VSATALADLADLAVDGAVTLHEPLDMFSAEAMSVSLPLEHMRLLARSNGVEAYGGYFRLGSWFVKLIGNPHLMRVATKHGIPHPTLMRFVFKLLANLTDPRGGDAMDRVINALSRLAPAA